MKIQLGLSDHSRSIAQQADIPLLNRYFEADPVLTDDQVSLLARPGMKRFKSAGDGPIRPRIYSQPGSFEDAAFFASYDTLYKLEKTGDPASIGTITGGATNTTVSMTATAYVGDIPEFLFIADGAILWLYLEDGFARGTLTVTGAISDGDTVRIADTYYRLSTGSLDSSSPAGTAANPWRVLIGASNADTMENLYAAIGDTGTAGTQYSTALTAHTTAVQVNRTGTTVTVRYYLYGIAGNATTTTETGANLAWGAATLSGGGSPSLTQVATPDDVAIVSVGYIGSHVIVVPAEAQGINGRFYWIEPGETVIDPLNFATAERAPDPAFQVVVFGDKFLLPGANTTEHWYLSGDPAAPMVRMQGVVYDRGAWEGTAVQVKDSMIAVDEDGGVFRFGAGIERISTPDIEQRIRQAMQYQAAQGF